MKKDEILDILKSLKSLAEIEYKAELVGLFGPFARKLLKHNIYNDLIRI